MRSAPHPARRPAPGAGVRAVAALAAALLAAALLAAAPPRAARAQPVRTDVYFGCGAAGCVTVRLAFVPWAAYGPALPTTGVHFLPPDLRDPAPPGTQSVEPAVSAVLSPGHALTRQYLDVEYAGTRYWRAAPRDDWTSGAACRPTHFPEVPLACDDPFPAPQWAVSPDFRVTGVTVRYIVGPPGAPVPGAPLPVDPGLGRLALTAVPEPATVALVAAGLVGVAAAARRRRRA